MTFSVWALPSEDDHSPRIAIGSCEVASGFGRTGDFRANWSPER
jgi:hypothetical protein